MQRRFAYLVIPVELLDADELTLQEKVLAAEIDALDRPGIGCTAKNQHFEGRLNVGNSRVKELIARLRKLGLIATENPTGNDRVIRSRLSEWVAARRATLEAEAAAGGAADRDVEGISRPECDRHENLAGQFPGHPPAGFPATPHPDTTSKEITIEKDLTVIAPNSPVVVATRPPPIEPSPTPPRPTLPDTGEGKPVRRRGRPPRLDVTDAPLFDRVAAPEDLGPSPEEIYSAYPRKEDRPQGIKQIKLAIVRLAKENKQAGKPNPEKEAREFLLNVTKEWAESWSVRLAAEPDAKQFIIYAQRFYRRERWTDDRTNWRISGLGGNGRNGNGAQNPRATPERFGQYAERGDYSAHYHSPGSNGGSNPFGIGSGQEAGQGGAGGSLPSDSAGKGGGGGGEIQETGGGGGAAGANGATHASGNRGAAFG